MEPMMGAMEDEGPSAWLFWQRHNPPPGRVGSGRAHLPRQRHGTGNPLVAQVGFLNKFLKKYMGHPGTRAPAILAPGMRRKKPDITDQLARTARMKAATRRLIEHHKEVERMEVLQPPFITTPPFTSGRNSGASGFEETLSPPPQESPIPTMPSQPMREGPGLLGMMQQQQYQYQQPQQQQYTGREESNQVPMQHQQPLQVQQVAAPAAAAAAASAGRGGGRVSGVVVGVSGQVASNVLGKEVRPKPQPPRGIGAPAGPGLGMGRQVHATGPPQPPSDREVITIDLDEDEEEPTGEQQQPSGTGRGAFAATAPANAAEYRQVYRLEEDIEKLEQEMAAMRIVGDRKKIWDLRKRTGVPAKPSGNERPREQQQQQPAVTPSVPRMTQAAPALRRRDEQLNAPRMTQPSPAPRMTQPSPA
ncbi:unnamed protein product [Vitrella brassicaformis CCMP3155]|uniref:Uncharacterized protein n=1 Tax=Vitrella brassicaformis (strain CCMP3155) TaxID=1169540 RepID=A0A0G4FTS2_VITBC|nr:unnamed protein product [Vitrella brassicaformis CCMP3155]|eukprot:CEM18345.1 unnamed protein product [Vitrella brassicaformis CCMP3155]